MKNPKTELAAYLNLEVNQMKRAFEVSRLDYYNVQCAIQRCLGACYMAQYMGLSYEEAEPLYLNARRILEGLCDE